MLREKLYAFISVMGMMIGIAALVLIAFYIQDERAFDRHLPDPENTFRIYKKMLPGSSGNDAAITPMVLHDVLVTEFGPDLVASTRVFNFQTKYLSLFIPETEKKFSEERFFLADSAFFDVFGAEFVLGDASTALANPMSLVLTQSSATRLFGEEDPIGKTLRFEGRLTLAVSAVIRDPNPRSHLQYDMLASFTSLASFYASGIPDTWYWDPAWTYIRLRPETSADRVEAALERIAASRLPYPLNKEITYRLQNVSDIWLNSELEVEIRPVGSERQLLIFGIIGLFVILVAGINSMNLAIARISRRIRDVSMRKLMGADTSQILIQFATENAIISVISAVLSIAAILVSLPIFNRISDKSFGPEILLNPVFWIFLLTTTVLMSFISGFYPARLVSRSAPIDLMRQGSLRLRGGRSRNLLITLQFLTAAVLLSGSQFVVRQIDHIRSADLGFDSDNVIVLPVANSRFIYYYEEFRERALTHPMIIDVTASNEIIGVQSALFDYSAEGDRNAEKTSYPFLFVMPGFDKVMDVSLLAGRAFSNDFPTDATEAVMMNASMVKRLGWESPQDAIGKWVNRDDFQYRVIGVVNDFNTSSLHKTIDPLMFEMPIPAAFPSQIKYVHVRAAPGQTDAVLAIMRELHAEFDPRRLLLPIMLNDELDKLYQSENRMADIVTVFGILAALIACLGLFGMASFTCEVRRKEISIRYVMGAQTRSLAWMLAKEFTLLVGISLILSVPILLKLMDLWLMNFAYRSPMDPLVFVITAVLVLSLAWISVGVHIWETVRRNPVDTLRYE